MVIGRRLRNPNRRWAFTLAELLVVVAILGILLALTAAAVQRVRASAQRARCAANVRELALALHSYASDQGRLPAGCRYQNGQLDRTVGVSWLTALLPYVGEPALADQARDAYRIDPTGLTADYESSASGSVQSFVCPLDPIQVGVHWSGSGFTWGLTSYRGVAGTTTTRLDGVLNCDEGVRFDDITDGTSNTLMIGERPATITLSGWFSRWGSSLCPVGQLLPTTHPGVPVGVAECPADRTPLRPGRLTNGCDAGHFWSLHSDGANFAFADASVRFLTYRASGHILPTLGTRAGGEAAVPPE